MALVVGFAEAAGAIILLIAAITGASFADILAGRAGEIYRQHEQAALVPSSAGTAAGAIAAGKAALSGSAAQILRDLTHRGVAVNKGAYKALSSGRIDQGKDFGGSGPVEAIADGTVVHVGLWPGWPGHGGVVYDTALGPVFVMEDFSAGVRVGQHVRSGQVIGHATGGSHGIESGLANPSHTGPLTPYNGAPDGTPMPGGKAFAALLGY